MKKVLSIALILSAMSAALFVYARISSQKLDFKQAEDFPRDALIYVQIQDLPALIKIWNESEIRRKYLESTNFKEFENRHLALKLAERASEIKEAIGIFPDSDFALGLSKTGAALAVYDIGKMEFVFIAPMSDEKIPATKLFEIRSDFDEIRLDDETTVYSKEIEIDRARQRQKILFANFRGRLILATSEKYFLQTLDNIKGKTPQNRLAGEPLFKQLAENTKPHLATVWLNQQKLNADWYFKHYWLMTETENLKNLRSGMFDFDIRDKTVIERRAFLTAGNKTFAGINAETANHIRNLIPENIPFYKIEAIEKPDLDEPVWDVLFDGNNNSETKETAPPTKDYYFNDWGKSYSYSYLDEDFSKQVNETGDDEILPDETVGKKGDDLTNIIGAVNPSVSLKISAPEALPAPLFFENRQALIFSVQNPSNLNRKELETALSNRAQYLFTVNDQKSEFIWTDLAVGNFPARQMTMPSLGWKIFYALRQNELFFSNSEDLLKAVLAANNDAPKFAKPFEKFTVINLKNGRAAFDEVFKTLENDEQFSGYAGTNNFFTGTIGSLLDVVSDVERIEIKQTSAQNLFFEDIDFVLKEKPQ
jgi:hypothetical protein